MKRIIHFTKTSNKIRFLSFGRTRSFPAVMSGGAGYGHHRGMQRGLKEKTIKWKFEEVFPRNLFKLTFDASKGDAKFDGGSLLMIGLNT